MYLVDASIFLEVELEQGKHTECEKFLEEVEKGNVKAIVSDFTIDSIAIVMESNGKSWKDVRRFLMSIALFKGMSVYSVKHSDKIKATGHMYNHKLDFDDSIIIQSAFSNNIKEIVSFDKDFDRIKEIRRLEPKEIL